jgi:hypothetical protein
MPWIFEVHRKYTHVLTVDIDYMVVPLFQYISSSCDDKNPVCEWGLKSLHLHMLLLISLILVTSTHYWPVFSRLTFRHLPEMIFHYTLYPLALLIALPKCSCSASTISSV